MMFTAKVTGRFVETRSVEAENEEEARELLLSDDAEILVSEPENEDEIEITDVEAVEEVEPETL